MRAMLVLTVMAGISGAAVADIYKCTDDTGHVTYSNVSAKNCKRLIAGGDEKPLPAKNGAKPAAAPTPAGFPRVDGTTQKARDDDRRRILETELGSEQKALEEARKALTEQEGTILPEERNVPRTVNGQTLGGINGAKVEARLQPFRDRVALHERNIEALKKEIGNLR